MLRSFVGKDGQFAEVHRILEEKEMEHLLVNVTEEWIQSMIMLLTPFEAAMRVLEGEKQPTIHLVLRTYEACLAHADRCCSEPGDVGTAATMIRTNLIVSFRSQTST
jgi:hypothetical protein